jgi:hypothetical protein
VENYSSHLSNLQNANKARQIQVHASEPLLPSPNPLGREIAISHLKIVISQDSEQFPAELSPAGSESLV